MKLYMFRAGPLPIIRSLFTVHLAVVCVIQICRQLSSRTRMKLQFHPDPARKLSVWHIPLLSAQWINSWWWAEELPKTCGWFYYKEIRIHFYKTCVMSTQSRCIQYNKKILTLWKLNSEEYPCTNITTNTEREGVRLKAGWTLFTLI